MDLNTLATELRNQAKETSTIVLKKWLQDSVLDSIRTAFALDAGENLTIVGVESANIPDPTADGKLRIKTGTTSVLKQSKVPVELTFTIPDGALQVVIVTDMADSWKFDQSFAGLDAFPFNKLTISGAHFVYTTVEHTAYAWPEKTSETIPLHTGLNFLSQVKFESFGPLDKVIGSLIGDKFYGALDNKASP